MAFRWCGLENPVGVACGGVHFVPPSETDETAAGYVLEVVEVDAEKEEGEDEYEDKVADEEDAEEVHQ